MLIFFLFSGVPSIAQETATDTIPESDSIIYTHSPRKATIYSIILPGLGQIYNKKYWKVPILYAGFGTLGYFISYNNKYYQYFKKALLYKLENNPNFETTFPDLKNLPQQSLQLGMDTYRRWRDMNGLGFILVYVLQVIDANVDANFFYYNIDKDITLKVHPGLVGNENLLGYAVGLKINLHF